MLLHETLIQPEVGLLLTGNRTGWVLNEEDENVYVFLHVHSYSRLLPEGCCRRIDKTKFPYTFQKGTKGLLSVTARRLKSKFKDWFCFFRLECTSICKYCIVV